MKKAIVFLFVLCLGAVAHAQSAEKRVKVAIPGGKHYLYRLTLTDKKGTPFSVKKPQAFLSQRAIDRRKRQHISVTESDLPVSPKYVKKIAATGAGIVGTSKWNNTVVVSVKDTMQAEELKHLSFVSDVKKIWASPDSMRAQKREYVVPELKRAEKTPESVYGVGEKSIDIINGKPLHEAGFRGKGMVIAILDGGFMNADKVEGFKNTTILGSRDCAYPRVESIFAEGDHGTKVLSCMGTNLPDMFIGTAPEASYWLIRSEVGFYESLCEEDFWAMAVEFADSVGADVINSSLGYVGYDDKSMNHKYRDLNGKTALISRTASMLADKGMVLANSAGNSGASTWKKINFPSDADHILTVGALTPMKKNATFSSVGNTADGRVKPDVMSLGNPAAVISGRGIITTASGTSFASPVLCGMVACLWQALPDKTAHEIIDIIRRSADNYETPDNIFGYGIPDFWKAYEQNKK
ncbi:MAG: S8 family serine peptidase [Prevotella sp.]|nr:S8 family serine peptidase [Prevotella sp.]